jgi:hypothetical protein
MWERWRQKVAFRTTRPSLLELIPRVPEDVLYDLCDVLSSIIMRWNPSDWIPENAVIDSCQLHEMALREGIDDERDYRFFRNFFTCFPDQYLENSSQMNVRVHCINILRTRGNEEILSWNIVVDRSPPENWRKTNKMHHCQKMIGDTAMCRQFVLVQRTNNRALFVFTVGCNCTLPRCYYSQYPGEY